MSPPSKKAKRKGVGHIVIRRPQSEPFPWDTPQAHPISDKAASGRQDTPTPPVKGPENKKVLPSNFSGTPAGKRAVEAKGQRRVQDRTSKGGQPQAVTASAATKNSAPADDPRDERYHRQTGVLRWSIREREKELACLPPGPTRDAVQRELERLRNGGMDAYMGRGHRPKGQFRTWPGLKEFLEQHQKEDAE